MSLLIRNVKILGGPKDLPETSDVFINGEIISAIGNFPRKDADEVIDGQGAYLAPGFIDVDTTSDHHLTILTDPSQEDFVRQGVTTIIGGHCGASLAPLLYGSLESVRKWADPGKVNVNWHSLGEFLSVLARRPLGVNFGTFIGHSTIRRAMIGEELRDLTANEIKVFSGVVERSLGEGAFGLSLGLEYVHTRATPYAELKAFAEIVRAKGGILSAHLRHTGREIDKAAAEIVKLQKETGVPLLISHFVPLLGAEEDYKKALAVLDSLPPEADVHADIYPFPGVVLAIYRMLPEWAQNGNLELMNKNIEDAWLSKRILKDLPEIKPEDFTVEAARNPVLVGKSLKEFMEISGKADVREALLELMRAVQLQAVISWQNVNGDLLESVLDNPRVFIGSHSASLKNQSVQGSFQSRRSRETFTAYLTRAEAKGVLAEGVERITRLPAHKFGLRGRGEVKEGFIADLTVFRAGEVRQVVLNGKTVLKDGNLTGLLFGKILKRT